MDGQRHWQPFFWVGLGFLWASSAPAFETVRILETTSTGRALILDRGIFEGIRHNDFALFYQKRERPGHFPSYHPVLKAEAIRVGDKISFWLAHESAMPGDLSKGKNLSMLRLSRHKQKHLKVSQYQIITPSSQSIDISKKDHKYNSEEISPSSKPNEKKDIVLNHLDTWQESQKKDLSRLSFKQSLPPVDKKTIAKSYEADHFSQIATRAIDKLNKSGNIDEYLSILKSPPAEYLTGKEPRWSRYMNDQQLQDFFVKSGVVEEVYLRQRKAVQEWKGSEINLRYATGLSVPLLKLNDDTFDTNYTLAIGYEYHLANIKPILKRWTVELGFGNHNSDLVIENYRFSSQEFFFKAWCYFYLYNTPLTLEQYLVYAGLGIQQGFASLSSPSLKNKYNYRISGFPTLRVGAKYKFAKTKTLFSKLNFGVHALLTMTPLNYQNMKRGRQFRGSSAQKISSTLSIGLSIYL